MKFRLLQALAAVSIAFAGQAGATGTDWPQHPVKIVVPFQAGSATDLISRQLGAALAQELGQPFVIEARPGAAAAIGSAAVARAEPDGYTLLMGGPAAIVTNRYLQKRLSYDPDSFELVSMVAYTPNILLANPSQPFKTLPEMVAYAKANPGKLTYASFGTGTTSHMAGEMLKSVAGIDILHVPYKGAGEAIPALLSGQVSMYFDTIMTGLPQVNSGKLVALGMSNAQRSAMAPQIPTIAEQGYSGYDIAPWYGLVAPHGTPAPVLDKLNQAVNKVLADPALRTKLAETGAEPQGGSREQFAAFIKAELPRTRKLVEQAGITPL
ncbi:Bug family tripartite tricarboxylate transporter substrate binding protein [Bordetella bronchiseptica]|uniref:Bug family tripartite tricarboxylate transporter substrate binding protein n=1 Tax=Bordetella bronchiseptica TaxID=518 RepID=UPI00045A895E|nr:tripartite tricarboxylate transporter substrate binding protein [Bordetella bronchiseptica]AOB26136.1 MFS transporter [Bordetella bronchiseptica]AZW43424.1 tripartite tricarboxylate transporter substrate binding protein [Bordetella bronchiseptica]KCV65708.1 tripartite tricarboxylate transporter family receptor [Bordetella bronchiseptica 99-R-0433]